MLDIIRHKLGHYQPNPLSPPPQAEQAAVLLPLTCCQQPKLILTQRAEGLSTHSGEVAFPGGMRDPEDQDLLHTALRESHEEVGINPDQVEVIGTLSPLVSRHGVLVTPYVGLVAENTQLSTNAAEIAAVFNVPLDFFADDPRQTTHRIDYLGRSWYVPSYQYDSYKIWGLTALMVVELVNIVYGRQLNLNQPPSC